MGYLQNGLLAPAAELHAERAVYPRGRVSRLSDGGKVELRMRLAPRAACVLNPDRSKVHNKVIPRCRGTQLPHLPLLE